MSWGTVQNSNPNLQPGNLTSLGGFQRLPDQRFDYFKAGTETYKTKPVVIQKGQVLKERTWLQRAANNTYVAYGSFEQSSIVTMDGSAAAADTVTIAGVTLTLSATATPTEIATAFAKYSDLRVSNFGIADAALTAMLAANKETAIGTWAWTAALVDLWHFAVDTDTLVDTATAVALIVSSASPVSAVTAFTASKSSAGLTTFTTTAKGIPGESFIKISGSALANTHTVTIGGVVFTAGATTATPAQIVDAFATGAVAGGAGVGALSGTNAGYTFSAEKNSNVLRITPTSANTTLGAVVYTTDATNAAELQLTLSPKIDAKVAGLLVIDVNATNQDTLAQAYIEGSFWVEGLNWKYNPGVPAASDFPLGAGVVDTYKGIDFVVNADGTATQCTPYWTGVTGYLDALAFIENSAGSTEFRLYSWDLKQGELRND